MHTFAKKMTRALLALAVALGGLALTGSPALAVPVFFSLCASTGTITMPDGVTVPIWGFSFFNGSSCDPATLPGPVLEVNVGDDVTIDLTNSIPGHTASFELAGLPVTSTIPGVYQFTASRPGTFVYQSPGDAGRQMAMGLYGALIVRPAGGPQFATSSCSATPGNAYGIVSTAFDRECVLVLSQVDPVFNNTPDTFDMNNYLATYWLINGKAYTDTAPIVMTGSLGRNLLLRYVNAGYDNTAMMLLGMHERVLARDAYLLNNPFLANAETIPAGGTEDVIATVPITGAPSTNGFPLYNRNLHVTNGATTAPTPFTGGFSPTIYGSLADLNGDGVVNGADDSNAFYGDTSMIDGGLDCDAWGSTSNAGTAGNGVIDSADDCTLIGYDGTALGVTINVVDGAFTGIPNGTPLPTVFNTVQPNNSVVAADFAWSTINGRVNSNGNATIDGDDCHFGLIGQAVDAGLGDATDGIDILGSDPGCGFAASIAPFLDGLVDLNSDMAITTADSCASCFFGLNVLAGVVSTNVNTYTTPGGMMTFIVP